MFIGFEISPFSVSLIRLILVDTLVSKAGDLGNLPVPFILQIQQNDCLVDFFQFMNKSTT